MPAENYKLNREDRMFAGSGIIGLRIFICILSNPWLDLDLRFFSPMSVAAVVDVATTPLMLVAFSPFC